MPARRLPKGHARRSNLLHALVVFAWGACLGAGLHAGVLLAAPEEQAPGTGSQESTRPAYLAAALLEEAFGAPCTEEHVPAPIVALQRPYDAQYRRYIAARCMAASGHLEEAEQSFRDGLAAGPAVPAIWHWSLLQTLILAKRHDAALKSLEALLQAAPDGLLRQRARQVVTEQSIDPALAPADRRGDYLVAYLEHVRPEPEDYDLLLRLWEQAGAAGNAPQQASLSLLLWRNPKDEATAQRWAKLPDQSTAAAPFPATAEDFYTRAERLFALGQFEMLAAELERNTPPSPQPAYAKALGRLYFRALIRGNQLSRAAVQINTESVVKRFSFDRRQQLIWAIRIQLKRRLIGPALKYLDELEQVSPKDEELPSIFFELLKYNLGQRDTVTTRHWLERLSQEFGASPEASDGYWEVIWRAIEQRDYADAQSLIEAAIAQSAPFHPVDQARLAYWLGRVQVLRGNKEAGAATWQHMEAEWPYGYYTSMAQFMREGAPLKLRADRPGNPPPPGPPPHLTSLWKVSAFPPALFLFAIGEADLASETLKDAVAQRLSAEELEEAGALFFYLERHYLQMRLLANHQLDLLRRSHPDGSALWQRAFPLPHWELVQQQGSEQGVDPFFIFAIIREESRFFSSAYSRAGAKGLMQLMPSTARMLAKRSGIAYDEERLHSPEFNIPLGTLYLKRVLERFEYNPVYAAAAYNAGPTNLQRWLKRYHDLPLDEFVERIPFGETQRYVKRVFLSYRVYSTLYR